MKRLLWLACISFCSWGLVACGDDDDTNAPAEDGGVASFTEVEERLDEVSGDLADLQGELDTKIDDVTGDLDEANTNIEDLTGKAGDLDERLAALEEVPKCSADEACMPDGIMVSQAGIAAIVEQLCTLEINCCDADELTYKFGPGITTVAECTTTFTDLVNNGFSPDFLNGNGVLINRVINMAQAINSNDVQIAIDPAAVKTCVDHLAKRECPKYIAPDAAPALHCTAPEIEEFSDPCALKLLAKGSQGDGEVCGITGVDECAAGLVCRRTAVGSTFGLCASPSLVGERCRRDADCDGTEQFCNLGTGKCQERSDEDEDCEYVDPTFKNDIGSLDPGFGYGSGYGWQNPTALKIECKQGLTCDPTTNKCVSYCSAGSICTSSVSCPDGLICNFSDVANMYMTFGYGICTPPLDNGKPCTCNLPPLGSGACQQTDGESKECASKRCAYDAVTDLRNECTEPFKAAGEACTLVTAGVSNVDATCASNRCGTDSKCTAQCLSQSDCPATHYCAIGESTTNGEYACEPKKANDAMCSYTNITPNNSNDNYECLSGFCQQSSAMCKPKVAAGGVCGPIAQDTACPSTQYCLTAAGPTYTCTNIVTAGGACTTSNECGGGAYCGFAGSNAMKCVAFVASGGVCDEATNDIRCLAGLTCAELGATDKCYRAGAFPVGAFCNDFFEDEDFNEYFRDTVCASTWCRLSDNTCQEPVAAGGDCDIDNPAKNRCATGSYCNYPALATTATNYGEGKCTAQGTAGQPCDPRFGNDCVSPGSCELRNDSFVCSVFAVVEETLFCDGE
jgi:hypothetical protein